MRHECGGTVVCYQVANFGSGAASASSDARGLGAHVEEPGPRSSGDVNKASPSVPDARIRWCAVDPSADWAAGEDRGDVLDGRRGACVEIKFRAPTPSTQPNSLVDFHTVRHPFSTFKWDHEEGCSLGSESSSTINEPAQLSRSTAAASAAPEPTQTHDTQSSASARAVGDPGMSSFTRSPQTPR